MPSQSTAAFSRTKTQTLVPRAETKRPTTETESAAGPLMAEECPLELTLATLRAQSSSASAGEGMVERRPAWSVHGASISALYAELRALLPNMPSTRRVNQAEIVDAAVAHVKVLEDTAAVLEAYRGVRPPPRRRPEVAVFGAAVCFSARLPAAGTGALRRVLEAFDRRGVEVLAATLAHHVGGGGGGRVADAVVTVTATAAPPEVLEMIRADIACIH